MGTTTRHLALLVGVAVLVLFVHLGTPPLWDRDEPRNAACAREMMERGDWVVPTFNGELRVLKPVMKYWLMISAYQLFGVNEFAARFWPAVFGVACAVATYFLGRRLFGPQAGLWAGLILLTNLQFAMAGHLAKIDTALTFFSLLALLIYVHAVFPRPGEASPAPPPGGPLSGPDTPLLARAWGTWLLVYAAIGLAILAKGLPGALPAAVIGLFLLIVRRPADGDAPATWWRRGLDVVRPFAPGHFLATFWRMRPLTAVAVVLAVAGPWYLLVGLRTDGAFLRGFFLDHHLGRAMEPLEQHGGPFLVYYVVTILLGFFPWSIFLTVLGIWMTRQLRDGHPAKYACLFLACWVGVYVVLFSCAQTKLPSYITPCFPALAVLLGGLMADVCARSANVPRAWFQLALLALVIAGAAAGVGLAVATWFIPVETAFAALGLVPLLGGAAALWLWRRERERHAVGAVAVAAVALVGLVFGVLMPRVGALQAQEAVCEQVLRHGTEADFGYFGMLEPSWVFYAGEPIAPIALPGGATAPANRWKAAAIEADRFFAGGPGRYVITTDADWHHLKPFVPADVGVVTDAPRFLRPGRWLVVGRPDAVAAVTGRGR